MHLKIYYEWDGKNQKYRVWRNDYPGDVFEMVDKREIEGLKKALEIVRIPFIEGMPDN